MYAYLYECDLKVNDHIVYKMFVTRDKKLYQASCLFMLDILILLVTIVTNSLIDNIFITISISQTDMCFLILDSRVRK